MLDIVLVAGLHVDAQHQAQRRHHVGVVAMRGPTGLVRVVAHHGAFLRAVQRLDRRVGIEDPGLLQQWRHAVIEMRLQPIQARGFVDLRQCAAHRIFAHHLAHAEQGRVHRVAAQRRNVRIALMTGENRQQQRAEHVALARRIRTGERQWAVRHPAVEQATLLQVFDEERQLTERRHRLRSIPLDVHPAAERVGDRRPFLHRRLLSPRVSQRNRQIFLHPQPFRRFGGNAQGSTAGSRVSPYGARLARANST